MVTSARIDELRRRYADQPRRYFAPLANALRQAGAHDDALALLREHLAGGATHLSGQVILGQTLFETGALAEAEAVLQRSRESDPGNRIVLNQLGEIASLRGDHEAAREWFARVRAAGPAADDVARQLAERGAGAVADAPEGLGEWTPAPDRAIAAPPAPVPHDATPHDATPNEQPAAAAAPPGDTTDEVQPAAAHAASDADDVFEPIDFDVALDPQAELDAEYDPVVGLDLPPAEPPVVLATADAQTRTAGGQDADEPAAVPAVGAPFVTATMGRLLTSQGHTDQAIAVYERLLALDPNNTGVRASLDALRGARVIDADGTSDDRADDHVVDEVAADDRDLNDHDLDNARAALLAAAFADLPIRADASQRVDAAPDARTPSDADDLLAEFSFDRFFSGREPSTATPAGVGSDLPTAEDDAADLARFETWLQGVPAGG